MKIFVILSCLVLSTLARVAVSVLLKQDFDEVLMSFTYSYRIGKDVSGLMLMTSTSTSMTCQLT